MGNDRIQVELFVVYLIGYAQLLMAFEQFRHDVFYLLFHYFLDLMLMYILSQYRF